MLVAMISTLAIVATACGSGGSDNSSSDGTRPMGDPVSSIFTGSSGLTTPATEWEGTLLGLVETGTSSFNSESGRCLVLLGIATATAGPTDSNPNSFLLPPISMKVGDEYIYPDDNKCDTEAIRSKGYDWLINMDVPVGTAYPFFSEMFLPGDSTAEPQSVILGNPVAGDSAQFYEPTIITEIPAPPA